MDELMLENKSGVFENAVGTLWINTTISTDEWIKARRLDINRE